MTLRSALVLRRVSRWTTIKLRLRVLRLTAHCLVLDDQLGGEAWFDRATGQGQRDGRGGRGGGKGASRSSDWRGWRLAQPSWSAVYVEAPEEA